MSSKGMNGRSWMWVTLSVGLVLGVLSGVTVQAQDVSAMNTQIIPLETNPSTSDMDNDGKFDDCETTDSVLLRAEGSLWTNALLPDTDGDGLLDGQEDMGSCVGTTAPLAMTNPRLVDTDGDGLGDGIEVLLLMTDPMDNLSPNPSSSDAIDLDGDGLPSSIDTDDNNADIDGDGYPDGYEVLMGSDPQDAASYPALGDVSGDVYVNNADAIMIVNFSLNNIASMPNPENGDVYPDGVINNMDAIVIFNFNLGNFAYIPFKI